MRVILAVGLAVVLGSWLARMQRAVANAPARYTQYALMCLVGLVGCGFISAPCTPPVDIDIDTCRPSHHILAPIGPRLHPSPPHLLCGFLSLLVSGFVSNPAQLKFTSL